MPINVLGTQVQPLVQAQGAPMVGLPTLQGIEPSAIMQAGAMGAQQGASLGEKISSAIEAMSPEGKQKKAYEAAMRRHAMDQMSPEEKLLIEHRQKIADEKAQLELDSARITNGILKDPQSETLRKEGAAAVLKGHQLDNRQKELDNQERQMAIDLYNKPGVLSEAVAPEANVLANATGNGTQEQDLIDILGPSSTLDRVNTVMSNPEKEKAAPSVVDAVNAQLPMPAPVMRKEVKNGKIVVQETETSKDDRKLIQKMREDLSKSLSESRSRGTRYDKEQLMAANNLRDDFHKDAGIIKAEAAQGALQIILKGLSEENGAGDIAAINQFQSGMVDPGATVREGDVSLMKSASPYAARLQSYLPQLFSGGQLSSKMREQIRNLAIGISKERFAHANETVVPMYERMALKAGLELEDFGRRYAMPKNVKDEKEESLPVITTSEDYERKGRPKKFIHGGVPYEIK